jgi:hypothetical protein
MNFINEEFFKKIKKKSKSKSDRVQDALTNILNFLNDNQIYDWSDFEKMSPFDRDIVNKIIDHTAKDMKDVVDIRFKLKLELCDRNQLRNYLKELESQEEFEKCAEVLKKINEK